jgi:hypothetical protein
MKSAAIFEILLLVVATMAFAWMAAEFVGTGSPAPSKEGRTVILLRNLFIQSFGGNLVSAELALWTCPQNNNGTLCQEYTYDKCQDNCAVACLPTRAEDTAQCALGTCIDPTEGTCSPHSPKQACDSVGGLWQNKEPQDIAQCKPGCCILGSETQYGTEQTCAILKQRTGIKGEFRPVDNEVACLALAHQSVEGACLLGISDTGKRSCKLLTKSECASNQGEFHEKILCSATELNTDCKAQVRTACVEGRDEVYWFDSCGNRENIYDSLNRNTQGILIPKNESCSLGTDTNPFAKQASCGNCNYLGGSICGEARSQDAHPSVGSFVCRDLSCVDSKGVNHKQGESWCVYDGGLGIGGKGNDQRSLDAPGSRHFKQVCLDGQIRTEPCADFRSEICAQSVDSKTGFSSAACRINQWQFCTEANTDPDKLASCEENPDCALKSVYISSRFNFKQCVPKYPPGFDLKADQGGEVAQSICASATVSCTYVKVKKFFGSKKINQECTTPAFTEAMNNFCASLGDCGAKVNYIGDFSDDGYSISNAPKLGASYKNEVRSDNARKAGAFVGPLNGKDLAKIYGIDATDPTKIVQTVSMVSGLAGIGLVAIASTATGSAILAQGGFATEAFATEGFVFEPGLSAAGGAVVGALIGAAISGLLIKYSGVGRGLSKNEVIALTVAGALAGAGIGYGLLAGSTVAYGWVPVAGWIAAVAVLAFIGLGLLFGVGKKKETVVRFQCLPWQPPLGGAKCEQCGKDGLPCSKYRCDSLGQTCKFLPENEGTDSVACVNSGVDNLSPPVISPNYGVKPAGYSYTSVSERGFKLQRDAASDGCLPAYSTIPLGINLDKAGQCRIEQEHTKSYSEMQNYFGGSNLFKLNHTMSFTVPSLDALAADANISLDKQEGEFSLYVRCTNVNGNSNDAEYSINFCVSPAPDRTSPLLSDFSPASPAPAAFEAQELNVSFLTSEPAECKWSDINQAYDSMSNEVVCANELEDATFGGWPCKTTIPLSEDNQTVYFRCNDQPWLTGNETDGRVRNPNTQSTTYTIQRTLTPLSIVRVTPQGEHILVGGLPAKITLEVKTAGGAQGTKRYCAYDFGSTGRYVDFFDSGLEDGNLHRQKNIQLFASGDYSIPITCYDAAGNRASDSASFSLSVDTIGPIITRIYDQSGTLAVITNENSLCSIKRGDCSFDFQNGTLLEGDELVHMIHFDQKIMQAVKCRDTFGNLGACISIQGGTL